MVDLEKYIRTFCKKPGETDQIDKTRVIQSRERRISTAQQTIRDYLRNQLRSALENFPLDGMGGLPN